MCGPLGVRLLRRQNIPLDRSIQLDNEHAECLLGRTLGLASEEALGRILEAGDQSAEDRQRKDRWIVHISAQADVRDLLK